MKIKLNGKEREAMPGESILELCKRENVPIPTFCYHQAFGGQGACRMCMVEVREEGQKEARLAAACTYLLNREAEVITESDRIQRIRRTIVMLLKRRAAGDPILKELADAYAAPDLEAVVTEPENCILCGLCIHACEEMGKSAIWSMFRGIDKRIATPYDEASDDCIGCAACARICPTHAISMEEKDSKRIIWNKSFELVACRRCGKEYATREEIEYLKERSDYGQENLCESCRKKTLAITVKNYI
ncbi:MAG: 2Fe-2S iron-sulfur cluster binding domain-containing protein [Syntrophomonadaceae bacterium]|jgi:NADH dehydrogenase/NADH:ubiquinone oxidoreductase subunit G|nr:2Fe-2S iron-sulfur cluster binding domain-containing protein [Syntrophomonadaceae bacterium]